MINQTVQLQISTTSSHFVTLKKLRLWAKLKIIDFEIDQSDKSIYQRCIKTADIAMPSMQMR